MRPMLPMRAPASLMGITYPVAAEIKHKGLRCICVHHEGKVGLYMRNGKIFKNFEEVQLAMKKMPEGVYDGEIVCDDFDKLMKRAFAERGEFKDILVEYKIFDRLTAHEWVEGKSTRTYDIRCIKQNIGERVIIKNPAELEVYYNYVLKKGHEGLVLKTLDSIYESGKNSHWFKMKPNDTLDLSIVSIDEGTGQFKGMMGGMWVKSDIKDQNVNAYVMEGFTVEQRKEFYLNKDKYIGKIVEIDFVEMSKMDKMGNRYLRYSTFKFLREDLSKAA